MAAYNNQLFSDSLDLTVVSYNMHGFNQGFPSVRGLIGSVYPDVFLLQEHWLTPANLNKFSETFPGYFPFGSSAMVDCMALGPLKGRPFGGVMTLIKNSLRSLTECIYSTERCVIVRIGDLMLINIYLPCAGTSDRVLICSDLFSEIASWVDQFTLCRCLIGGDFNIDLDSVCEVSLLVNRFSVDYGLTRCDKLFGSTSTYTYDNVALNHKSYIDYMLTSDIENVREFAVMELDDNLSDHLPIMSVCSCNLSVSINYPNASGKTEKSVSEINQLRWDHADLSLYYYSTLQHLQPIASRLN
jgi:hypothetical protein